MCDRCLCLSKFCLRFLFVCECLRQLSLHPVGVSLLVHPTPFHELLDQGLDVDVEPASRTKVRITAALVQHDLRHTLLNQFVVGRSANEEVKPEYTYTRTVLSKIVFNILPDLNVIPYAEKMLEYGQHIGLCRRVHDHVLDELEALIDVVQLKADVVEALRKLVKVFVPVLVEHFQLGLKLFRCILIQSLEKSRYL